jgi:outer membrane protein OmpA-like peptidoglycan-associated protein
MVPIFKIWLWHIIILLVFPFIGYADTILLKNGDQLNGKIQSDYVTVMGAYGQIAIQKDFCKKLLMTPDQFPQGSVQTVNNDELNGRILNREFQIERVDGELETIDLQLIEALYLDFSGSTYRAVTTIFTMTDGSRISGKVITPEITIYTDYLVATHAVDEINRIDFGAATGGVQLLLTTGDRIDGKLSPDQFVIKPDSFGQLAIDQADIKSIQFNSRKMLVRQFSGNATAETITASQARETSLPDEDKDGIPDGSDSCPRTPLGAKIDGRGCWIIPIVLFEFDSDQIKPAYAAQLNQVSTTLMRNPTVKIEIRGGTDNVGSSEHNQTLSENRAQAVKLFLVQSGVEAERLSTVGYGSSRNTASNQSPEGRALNRRVDFRVVK